MYIQGRKKDECLALSMKRRTAVTTNDKHTQTMICYMKSLQQHDRITNTYKTRIHFTCVLERARQIVHHIFIIQIQTWLRKLRVVARNHQFILTCSLFRLLEGEARQAAAGVVEEKGANRMRVLCDNQFNLVTLVINSARNIIVRWSRHSSCSSST